MRSNTRPTVGLEASPSVVSDSPHLALTHSSPSSIGSRCSSVANWVNSIALRAAISMVFRSPYRSMLKLATGLPVLAIPLATQSVHFGSMPITTAAATLGLAPAPMRVFMVRSRSSPNCKRPYGWTSA